MNRKLSALLVAGVAISASVLATATARAEIPNLEVEVQVLPGGYQDTSNPFGFEAIPGTMYTYNSTVSTEDFAVTNNVTGLPDADGMFAAKLATSSTIENNSADSLSFVVSMTLPTTNFDDIRNWTSAISLTLTGPGSPVLFSLQDRFLWEVETDAGMLAQWGLHPSYLQGDNASTNASLDQDTALWSHGAANPFTEVTIRTAFSLSAGATATVNGSVTFGPATPGPAGLAVFGLAFLRGSRRRR